MAATTAPPTGIQGWMTSIRTAMVEDPNRKMFEEQVQTHGFQFFKEYLDNVLENAKQQDNAIVDLLKTPGRRKGAPKKTRAAQAAAARAQDAIKFSFEDGATEGKENGPVNKFHEALLQAKRTEESEDANARVPLSPKRHDSNPPESPRKAKGKGKAVKLAADENQQAGFIDLSSSPAPPPAESAPPKLAKELSMIAEDDEMMSHAPRRALPAQPLSPDTYDISPTRNFTLAPPAEEEDGDMIMEDEAPAPPSPSPPRRTPLPADAERYPSPSAEPEVPTAAIPSEPPAAVEQEAALPATVSLQDVTAHPIPPHLRTSGKATLAAPPVAPSGLYASASNPNMPVATTSGGTKRTSSWTAAAMKARGSSTAGTGLGNLAVAGTGHLKRKSGDMGPPLEPERVKHPKTSHGEAMEVDTPAIVFPAPAAEEAPTDEEPLTRMLKRMQGSRQTTKSIGNAAVVAELAKAKAAAERRVADKYGLEPPSPSHEREPSPPPAIQTREEKRPSREAEKRFSVSELFTSKEGKPAPSFAPPRAVDLSASTTPPDSPVVTYKPAKPPVPVFTKPAPVFVPPPAPMVAEASTERSGLLGDFSFKLPASSAFTRPQLGLGMAPLAKLSPRSPRADSGASTQESEPVDPVFDSQPLSRQVSSSTQGTSQSHSQSQLQELKYSGDYVDYNVPLANDEDDTWGIDEKLAATTQTWTPYTTGGNTDTWSSGQSDTQTQPAGAFTHPFANVNVDGATWSDWPTDSTDSTRLRPSEDTPVEDAEDFTDAPEQTDAYVDDDVEDVDDVEPSGGVRLVQAEGEALRPESQLSMASSSDESQHGMLGQASKFVSSIFGGGPGSTKKKDGPIKSVQLAAAAKAAAAKKAQEEEARKANRQKDMEARRQAAIQRKAEEERQRLEEEERKAREAREDVERRRKEREEAAAKRAKAVAEKKTSDDEANKKKIVEKPKSAMKKPAPMSKIVKPTPAPAAKSKPLSKQASASSLNDKSMKFGPPKGKAKAPAVADSDVETKPKAGPSTFKTPAPAPPPKPETPEEWIDLPEPNSEYSNSDDEDKGKDYDVADWAQSPVLFNQLREQETMDPDDIFGPIRPLRMEEMFTGRARQSRFRARSSSANWAHGDGLTEMESREYARRMGFR